MSKSIISPPAMPPKRAMIVTSLRTVGGAVEEEVVGERGVVGIVVVGEVIGSVQLRVYQGNRKCSTQSFVNR